ncbi:MAG: LPS-assembly protein LptD [Ignavibacteriae bacterium]|nr:MAG: LPS-assembly protein LptD [Ignavibacteriota bacterium]
MKYLLLASIIFIISSSLFAQQNDTLLVVPADTLLSAIIDTLAIEEIERKSDIDTVVYANATDSLIFFVKEKKMAIYGEGKIHYKSTEISSANIIVDFEKYEIDATGVPKDSASGELTGTPVLVEGSETYEGSKMRYNFKTGQGSLSMVDTEIEGAFYHGVKIKKVSKDTYFIEDGIYTTCDEDCPHYYIYSPKMKVIQQEQMAAEWIFLHFGEVPLPIPIPFAVLPLESGRRSGLIAPVLGSDATFGTYFGRFGYYWAMSDYMDWNVTADYYTRGSFNLNSRFRYVKRYNFSGNIEGSYSDFSRGESTDPDFSKEIDWRIRWFHNQTLTPTLRFDANLEFATKNYLTRNVANFNDLLRNEIISNATLSKTWDESGNSATINYSRRQVIQTNDIYEVLPSMSFRKAQSYPFRSESSGQDKSWYELFGYSYTGQFQNNRNKVDGDLKIRGGIKHNINADLSPKFGHFSFSPSFRYEEKWYNKQVEKNSVLSSTGSDSVVTSDVHKIDFVRTFSVGVGTSTKFYGMFSSIIPGISAIRHSVTPSLSYSYRPDFSESKWGYYGEYTSQDGSNVKYNKFEREIFGGATSGEQQNLNFSVGNNLEMKTIADPTDTTSKENKIQLLNLNMGMSYNFAADSLNFSDLRLTYRTQISDIFDFSGSSSFTPYDYASGITRINKFLVSEGKGILRMTNFNFSVTTRLSGDRLKSETGEELLPTNEIDEFGLGSADRNVYQGIYTDRDPDFNIPWDISLTYNYNLSRPTPELETKFSNLSGSLNFNLTPKWKFSVTGSYDIENDEFAAPQIRISRDLHCWIMNFTWNPIGTYTGFRFEVRVKAPQLQDLKITKQDQFYNTR